ncbi:hypothetical protein WBG78_23070 [Chryseolinea sp. T2]|uniref:hypothetical protein n=1 Tax=Chryseolinea sp. T2 TaxID=3129255 RepID=UPI0030770208
MKTLSLLFSGAVLCSVLASCKSTALLQASFEEDAVGSSPNKTLPGDPTGDELLYVTEMEPRLKVQNSTIAGSKALHFSLAPIADISGHQKGISFKGASTDLTQTVWFMFSAQNNNASSDVYMDLSDGGGHPIARLTIHTNGDVALTRDLTYVTEDIIGNVGNEVHTIVFTTFAGELKYNVTIFKETGPAITVQNKNMLTTNATSFLNPARPQISFSNQGTSGAKIYAIGNVSITKKKPNNMP